MERNELVAVESIELAAPLPKDRHPVVVYLASLILRSDRLSSYSPPASVFQFRSSRKKAWQFSLKHQDQRS